MARDIAFGNTYRQEIRKEQRSFGSWVFRCSSQMDEGRSCPVRYIDRGDHHFKMCRML